MACISGVTCRHSSMHNACISGDKKGSTHIRLNYDIFGETIVEKNWTFEFILGKYPISNKKIIRNGVREVKL
jgi:hypothetical protein